MRIVAILAAVLLAGCVSTRSTPSYHLSVDSAFTPAEQEQIASALLDWEAKTSATFDVAYDQDVSTCADACIHRGYPADDAVQAAGGVTRFHGEEANSYVRFIGDNGITPDQFRVLVTHEVGHVLGLQHTSDPDCVMRPGSDDAHEVTACDVAQFDSIWSAP